MHTEHPAPPTSATTLRQKLAHARERLTNLHVERQQLGLPILKDRLHRRDELALEAAAVELEIATVADAIPLKEAEEQRARRDAEQREREQLTIELRSALDALMRDRDQTVIVLSEKTAPTVEDLRDLRQRGRQCEDMRTVLLAATHEGFFTKSDDPVDRLERLYRDQQRQRERSFALLRGPGAPRPPLPRNDKLARLRELLSETRSW